MDIDAGDIGARDAGARDAEAVRACYAGAAQAFLELACRVPPQAWSLRALGEWDVRALTGHTSRALTTVEAYLATPATGERVAGPAEYFLAVRGATSPDAIAQRGRETGEALGEDPAAAVRELVQRVTALVRNTPDDALVATPAGAMRTPDRSRAIPRSATRALVCRGYLAHSRPMTAKRYVTALIANTGAALSVW